MVRNIYGKRLVWYEWQKDAASRLMGVNGVLTAPTGAGKSVVAYGWAGIVDVPAGKTSKRSAGIGSPGGKVIFTAPIKALSNERYFELRKILSPDRVGINTGDVKINTEADVICCTQETFNKVYMSDSRYTRVIIDEVHYALDNPDRLRAYVEGIAGAVRKCRDRRVLLVSATIGRMDAFRKYIRNLTGEEFALYECRNRPVPLKSIGRVDIFDKSFSDYLPAVVYLFSRKGVDSTAWKLAELWNSKQGNNRRVLEEANRFHITNKFVIELANRGIGVYHGCLLFKEKLFVESLLRSGHLNFVVGTDALSLGVNIPVKTAVFGQLVKYYQGPISKREFEQMKGRAGRPGLFDTGFYGYTYTGFESFDHDTGDVFEELEKQDLFESGFSVNLQPDYRRLITGTRDDIEKEVEFIARASYPPRNESTVRAEIENILDEIDCIVSDLSEQFDMDRDRVREIFGRVYFEEFDLNENGFFLEYLLENDMTINAEELVKGLYPDGRGLRRAFQYRKLMRRFTEDKNSPVKVMNPGAVERWIQSVDPFSLDPFLAEKSASSGKIFRKMDTFSNHQKADLR